MALTIVAWDGKSIACDSRITGGFIQDDVKKIFKLGNRYIGIAGTYSAALLVIQWMKDKTREKPKLEIAKDDEFEAIEIKDGKCFYYDENLIEHKVSAPYAIGSGSAFAMGAMSCGKSASEAVGIAKKYDESCGGKTVVYKI